MILRNRRWQAVLMVLFVFALGFIAGGLSVNFYRSQAENDHLENARYSHKRPEEMIHRLTAELSLTPEQENQVQQILAETRQHYNQLRQEVHPRFQAVRDQSRARIRAVLNPEQQAKFDGWVRRQDELYNNHRGRDE